VLAHATWDPPDATREERRGRRPCSVTSGVLLLWFGALLLLDCKVAFHDRGTTIDDAFNVFRYAENLVGFRWNATGMPFEGFSSTVARRKLFL
jgi:hypothetical protein